MTEHTPGPWAVFSPGDEAWPGIEATDLSVSIAVFEDQESGDAGIQGRTREEAIANARLIAAAPDLLRALKALHACHRAFSGNDNWTTLDDEARIEAEAAIRLACDD